MKKIQGKVKGIYISNKEDSFSVPVNSASFTFEGMVGDKHASINTMLRTKHPEFKQKIEVRNTRQISLMSVEELSLIAEDIGIPEIKAEWLTTNLLISGIPHLSQLPPGTRFYFDGGLILYNEGQNFPCKTAGNIILEKYPHIEGIQHQFIKSALDKRGLIGWVEHPKVLHVGSSVEVDLPPEWQNLWEVE
ncbi:MAG TPA: hypothetical protein VK856_08615 [Anaerolineaceae bacterium]|nr:hypothetical protein [Anaerolineaceae bacterium]